MVLGEIWATGLGSWGGLARFTFFSFNRLATFYEILGLVFGLRHYFVDRFD